MFYVLLLQLPVLSQPLFGVASLIDVGKIFGVPVALYLMARFITKRDKTRDETANEKKTWRAARLAEEESTRAAIAEEKTHRSKWQQRIEAEAAVVSTSMKDSLASEKSERTQWQLKREAEAALVAGILEESAEAQKLIASIVSTTRHLEGGQTRIDGELRELRTLIGVIQSQLMTLASTRNAHS